MLKTKGSDLCRDEKCGLSYARECGCKCYGKGHGKMIPKDHPAYSKVPKLSDLYLYPTHANPKVVLKSVAKKAAEPKPAPKTFLQSVAKIFS